VDRAVHRTNSANVSDFINIFANPKTVNPADIADLYIKKRLSAKKLAVELGLSKAAVLRRLHHLGIRKETVSEFAKEHPRPVTRASFGFRIVDGRLVPDRQEQKVARFIVELRQRQNLPWNEVVKKVNLAGHRTKQGLPWKIGTVRMVFASWRGKV
jgi:hypothetical protein